MSSQEFGSWKSPLSSDLVLSSAISLVDVVVTLDKTIVYVEGRPNEGGRNAIVADKHDVIPVATGFNARTGIHEYGGGAVAIVQDKIIFSDLKSGAVFQVEREAKGWGKAVQITPSEWFSVLLSCHPDSN